MVTLQDVPAVNWSRTYFYPNLAARGAANWGSVEDVDIHALDRESSATHDGEKTG